MEASEENEHNANERIAYCKMIVKQKVRMTSAFRDHLMLPLVIRMALSKDPEAYLNGVLGVFDTIRPTYFTGSGQRLITAMVIYENTPEELVDYICERTYKIYEKMKIEHPLLTGQEDMAFAALVALDGERIDSVIEEMEDCYKILKKEYVSKMSAMQNVSHVLSLTDEDPKKKTEKYIALHNALSAGRKSNGLGSLLIVLAVLSILDMTVEETVREVREMAMALRRMKRFSRKFDSIDFKLISCALVAMCHLPEDHVVIHNVQVGFLKTILRTSIITALVVAQSSLAISSHR
ncbi:MAG: DUF4003 domain-containing protein [Lachnospiraceae bacterium]|nr:DUF4003 domain-containing protein [Lachnospiraceae bacterium]